MPHAAADTVVVRPSRGVSGRTRVPGDKSISHRYAMLAALADGASSISGYSGGADCRATLACLAGLGVDILRRDDEIVIEGRGLTVGEDHDRYAFQVGARHAVDDGRRARPERRQARADLSRNFSLRYRSDRTGGLCRRQYERQPCPARRRDQIQVPPSARHAKQRPDARFA